MTDKDRTLLIIAQNFENPNLLDQAPPDIFNQLISEGNSQLLVLRKASLKNQLCLFNAVTSLSQIDGDDLSERIQAQLGNMGPLEKRISGHMALSDKHEDKLFSNMFHKEFSAALYATDSQIKEWGSKVGMQILENQTEIFDIEQNQNKLSILQIQNLQELSSIETTLKEIIEGNTNQKWIIRVVFGPLPIDSSLIIPNDNELQNLLRPKQSFEKFGSIELDPRKDISTDLACIAIEHDKDYCRVDNLSNLEDLKTKIQQAKSLNIETAFLNFHMLADTLMREIAFKMGKFDKFGS